jgi:hypothetical protein
MFFEAAAAAAPAAAAAAAATASTSAAASGPTHDGLRAFRGRRARGGLLLAMARRRSHE